MNALGCDVIGFGNRRGTALTMSIVVAVVMTGLVSVLAWVAGEQAQRAGSLSKTDQAFYAAETGAQRLQWYCRNHKLNLVSSPLTGTVNGYTYSVAWTSSGNTCQITSTGVSGAVSYTLSEAITTPSLPAIASGIDFDNKNIDVTGDVIVGNAYDNGGSGSITGSLTYYGSADNTNSVSGSVTHGTGAFPSVDMSALASTLIAAAGQTYSGNQANRTFDFASLSGTNKVIYVDGNVTKPSFIGAGTLYVHGTVSTDDFGTSSAPVNIVASGTVTTSNNVTLYGSIYTAGMWNRGKFDLTGMVYAAGGIQKSNNGKSTLDQTSVPWFDPRSSGSGGTLTVGSFTGPQP